MDKAQQKNVNKENTGIKITKPKERWFHDIATIKAPKKSGIKVGRSVWHMTVDEFSGLKMSGFYKKKAEIVEPMCERINGQKDERSVKFNRQDNAGENKSLQS